MDPYGFEEMTRSNRLRQKKKEKESRREDKNIFRKALKKSSRNNAKRELDIHLKSNYNKNWVDREDPEDEENYFFPEQDGNFKN